MGAEMKIALGLSLVIISVAFAASAAPANDPYIRRVITASPPPPPQHTAHTTPTTNVGVNLLPQARQVNNPTGPVPNALPFLAPPALPQARQVGSASNPTSSGCSPYDRGCYTASSGSTATYSGPTQSGNCSPYDRGCYTPQGQYNNAPQNMNSGGPMNGSNGGATGRSNCSPYDRACYDAQGHYLGR